MSVDANCKADPGLRILGGGLGFQYSFALSKVMCNKRITNVANMSHYFNSRIKLTSERRHLSP